MNIIYLKFLLEDNHFLVVTMPEDQARSILDRFKDGTYSPEYKGVLSGTCSSTGAQWVVQVSRVMAAHTIRPEDLPQQQGNPPRQQTIPFGNPGQTVRFSGGDRSPRLQ